MCADADRYSKENEPWPHYTIFFPSCQPPREPHGERLRMLSPEQIVERSDIFLAFLQRERLKRDAPRDSVVKTSLVLYHFVYDPRCRRAADDQKDIVPRGSPSIPKMLQRRNEARTFHHFDQIIPYQPSFGQYGMQKITIMTKSRICDMIWSLSTLSQQGERLKTNRGVIIAWRIIWQWRRFFGIIDAT